MSKYEALKDPIKLAQKAGEMDLYERLLDVRSDLQEIREENIELREHVQELERQENIAGQLEYDDGVYWRSSEGQDRKGPFCQLCWDRDRDLIRLQDVQQGYFMCLSCENSVAHNDATGGGGGSVSWPGR